MENLLSAIEIVHGDAPTHAVIWMHGLGADGSDFVPVVPELGLPAGAGVRFVFPDAPEMPVTCNGGWVMPAWYDILSLAPTERKIDEAGLWRSCDAVRRLIAREAARGIPAERVFLAGFSQGGAVAYTTALTHAEALAGVVALSTYIPSFELIERHRQAANASLPVFAAHGIADDVVAPELGLRARDWLAERGHPLTWREYPVDHSVTLPEIREIGAWLGERLR